MLRAVLLAVFMFFIGQTTGAFAAVRMSVGGDCCPDEASEEAPCPPFCHECVCGVPLAIAPPAALLVAVEGLVTEPEADEPPTRRATSPPRPEPREILRVPRPTLA